MTKKEFLSELKKKLRGLSANEARERINFYSEIIDDKIEEGLSEQDAVGEVGNVDDIAEQIIGEMSEAGNKPKSTKNSSVAQRVLLIIGSPIWVSILISVYAVVWSVVIALWAVEIPLYIIGFISKYLGIACVACAKFAGIITKKCCVSISELFRG